MQIKTTLMGGLRAQAPPDNILELADGGTILDALAALDIEPTAIQVVMHNGKPQRDHSVELSDEDEITVLPPVAGG